MISHRPTTLSSGPGNLTYEGTDIRKRGQMLNLTDMWRAAGAPAGRRPSLWLALGETAQFRSYLRTLPLHGGSGTAPLNVGQDDIMRPETDGLVIGGRGKGGATWAHWQLALAYAQYLSPPFHHWCNEVVRTVMEQPGTSLPPRGHAGLLRYLERCFATLHRRLDDLDRHGGDLMFLAASAQELLLGKRREFSERSRLVIRSVVTAPPYEGHCPSCSETAVLSARGACLPGAEFDHFFHSGLNRPEHGWLICRTCHHDLTTGGYLVRFAKMPEFRAFQTKVVEHRRQHVSDDAP